MKRLLLVSIFHIFTPNGGYYLIIGSFSSNDGDGNENVIAKYYFLIFVIISICLTWKILRVCLGSKISMNGVKEKRNRNLLSCAHVLLVI